MIPALRRPRRRDRVGLAFSEHQLVLSRPGELLRSVALPSEMLEASAVSANIKAVSELGKLAAALLEGQERPRELVVVLPNLSVSTLVMPGARRSRKRELLRALSERLPYPASEARMDFWPGFGGEVLGAAIRSVVASQYEQVVEAVGARLGWMDAATLVSVPLWARHSRGAGGSELSVELELYHSHYSIAAFRGGELVDLRFKLRPPGDVSGVAGEVERLPRMYDETPGVLSMAGEGASALAEVVPGVTSASELGEDELLARAASNLLARAEAA